MRRPWPAHSRLVMPSRLAATMLGILPGNQHSTADQQAQHREPLLRDVQRGSDLHCGQGSIVHHCRDRVEPKQERAREIAQVGVSHRSKPGRKSDQADNENINFAGPNQNRRERIALRNQLQSATAFLFAQEERGDRDQYDSHDHERAQQSRQVKEVGVQRGQNQSAGRHPQGRHDGAQSDREASEDSRGDFGGSIHLQQRDSFREHECRHDCGDEPG